MNAGKPKILFCSILYAMIFHEDELISLNTPAQKHTIFSLAQSQKPSSHSGDQVIRACGRYSTFPTIWFLPLLFPFVASVSASEGKKNKKRHIKILIARTSPGPCSLSALLTSDSAAVTERALLSILRIHERRGNFRRGWIYNFILTWLILHREVFVQEAACLIMVQLCLAESKHDARDCQQELRWHVTRAPHVGVGWRHPPVAQISRRWACYWLSNDRSSDFFLLF